MTRVLRVAAVTLLAVLLGLPAGAQDLETVQREKEQLESDIATTAQSIESLEARIALTEEELANLEVRAAELEERAATANASLQDLARRNFKRGEMSTLESLLNADGPGSALERARILSALSRNDLSALQSSTALRTQLEQTRALMSSKRDELAELEVELEAQAASLQDRFSHVSAVYRELKTRRDRQRTIARGAQQGIYACIFAGPHHFTNSWGAPRSGGRRHEGTDLMAPYGQEVYAFTTGYIKRLSSSGLGGIGLYLWGDDGVQYYYAHLSGFADGIYPGKRVEAGQLIAYNGSSGNASRGAPHVHFEVHPGGGGPVNPYHWLTPVC